MGVLYPVMSPEALAKEASEMKEALAQFAGWELGRLHVEIAVSPVQNGRARAYFIVAIDGKPLEKVEREKQEVVDLFLSQVAVNGVKGAVEVAP